MLPIEFGSIGTECFRHIKLRREADLVSDGRHVAINDDLCIDFFRQRLGFLRAGDHTNIFVGNLHVLKCDQFCLVIQEPEDLLAEDRGNFGFGVTHRRKFGNRNVKVAGHLTRLARHPIQKGDRSTNQHQSQQECDDGPAIL